MFLSKIVFRRHPGNSLAFLKFDEQMNLIFAVMLFILWSKVSVKRTVLWMISEPILIPSILGICKEISYDDCRKLGDFVVNVIFINEGRILTAMI